MLDLRRACDVPDDLLVGHSAGAYVRELRRNGSHQTYTTDRVMMPVRQNAGLPDVVCGGQRLPKTVFR